MNKSEDNNALPIKEGLFEIVDGEYFLVAAKCNSCQRHFYPPVEICPVCFIKDMERVHLSRRGTLTTWTVVWIPPAGFERPYALAYVDLPEKVRVFGHLADYEADKLKPGMEMELVIGKIKEGRDGKELLGPKFRPVSE